MEQTTSQIKNAISALSKKDVAEMVRKRNPETNADEIRIFILAVLVIATVFCGYTGYLFYKETFGQSFSPTTAFLFAIALAAVVEVSKVMLGTRVLMAFVFGWVNGGWWNTGLYIFATALFFGAFYWSVQISTDGMQLLTRNRSAERDTSAMAPVIAAATRDIDAQIAAAQNIQAQAMGNKWKGTTTWESQKTATQQGKTIASLQAQRATIIERASDEYNRKQGAKSQRLDLFADWVRKYGGFSELACALALLALAMNDRRIVEANMKRSTPEPEAQQGPTFQASPTRVNGFYPQFSNQDSTGGPRNQVTYFNRSGDGNVISAPVKNQARPSAQPDGPKA